MIKRLKLTEDHLKLISLIRFETDDEKNIVFVDLIDPYLLSGRLEDLAMVCGLSDKKIPGTEYDAEGAAFPDEVEEYLLGLHHYICDNLYDIEVLLHQFSLKGGVTPGVYKCVDNEEIWQKEE